MQRALRWMGMKYTGSNGAWHNKSGSPPKGLDVHREARDGVCEGGIESVVRPSVKQRLQPVLPAVEGLREVGDGRQLKDTTSDGRQRPGACGVMARVNHGPAPARVVSKGAAISLTAGVMREALGPSTSSSVRLHVCTTGGGVSRQASARATGQGVPQCSRLAPHATGDRLGAGAHRHQT